MRAEKFNAKQAVKNNSLKNDKKPAPSSMLVKKIASENRQVKGITPYDAAKKDKKPESKAKDANTHSDKAIKADKAVVEERLPLKPAQKAAKDQPISKPRPQLYLTPYQKILRQASIEARGFNRNIDIMRQ